MDKLEQITVERLIKQMDCIIKYFGKNKSAILILKSENNNYDKLYSRYASVAVELVIDGDDEYKTYKLPDAETQANAFIVSPLYFDDCGKNTRLLLRSEIQDFKNALHYSCKVRQYNDEIIDYISRQLKNLDIDELERIKSIIDISPNYQK